MTTIELPDMSSLLAIPLEKVCFIAIKAREFDAKDVDTVPDGGSNPVDDGMRSVLEDRADDPVFDELAGFIGELNEDEQIDLVALAWLGRNGASAGEWAELRETAADAHNEHTADYLLGMPLLSTHLETGLSALDVSCEDTELNHL